MTHSLRKRIFSDMRFSCEIGSQLFLAKTIGKIFWIYHCCTIWGHFWVFFTRIWQNVHSRMKMITHVHCGPMQILHSLWFKIIMSLFQWDVFESFPASEIPNVYRKRSTHFQLDNYKNGHHYFILTLQLIKLFTLECNLYIASCSLEMTYICFKAKSSFNLKLLLWNIECFCGAW